MRTRRENLLCNGCVKDRAVDAPLLCAERNGRYFAKLKREPHAIRARAYARMRQTRARVLHVCSLSSTRTYLVREISSLDARSRVNVNYVPRSSSPIIIIGAVWKCLDSLVYYFYRESIYRYIEEKKVLIPSRIDWGFVKNSCTGIVR